VLRRRPPLPDELEPAWLAFQHCADLVARGNRSLVATLPAGRVEPAPVGRGLDAIARCLVDARAAMPDWRAPEMEEPWGACQRALDAAEHALPAARAAAGDVGELDALLVAVDDVIAPLAAFADAERAWRRYRLPTRRR
jgi:hypothetical protein